MLTSARNLNLLKIFIYIHLKDFIMLFQKIVCFIGVWITVPKKCSLTRDLTKFINYFFLKSETRTFKCIYINFYSSLRYFVDKAPNCKKDAIFDNLRTITQEWDIKTRQMIPFFHLLFESFLFRKLIFAFEFSKFIFMGSSPFGPVWAAKYLNFGGKNCEVRTLSLRFRIHTHWG